jgi:hypothetical protein
MGGRAADAALMLEFLTEGPKGADAHVLLAHGAGAPMTSAFMTSVAQLLAARGCQVSRFEFAYMAKRRQEASRRPPPRAELLQEEYLAAVAAVSKGACQGQRLVIGGKSLGGRVASMIAERLHRDGRISGLVCLGYPFHPPGKPLQLRTSHLRHLSCPTLIVQGESDPFGSRAEVAAYALSPAIRLHWIEGAGHDLICGRADTRSLPAAADAVAEEIRGWCNRPLSG